MKLDRGEDSLAVIFVRTSLVLLFVVVLSSLRFVQSLPLHGFEGDNFGNEHAIYSKGKKMRMSIEE
jgi:hypothetical protein